MAATKKNGHVTKLQMSRALGKVQRDTIDAMIAEFRDQSKKLRDHNDKLETRVTALERAIEKILGSDFALNHAAFKATMRDFDEGMEGSGISLQG
jgi:thiamine kinase-like enzyme